MRVLLLGIVLFAAARAASSFMPSSDELDRLSQSGILALPAAECTRAVRERNPGATVTVESEQRPGPSLVVVELRADQRDYACSAVWTADGRSIPFVSQR